MASKIKELLNSEKTVYIFDVDGTLTPLEYGEYNHYKLNDEEWAKSILEEDGYKENRPIKVIQKFLENKNMQQVYVVTKVMNEKELEQKKNFLEKNYHIIRSHVYLVYKNEEKLEKIKEIRKEYKNIEEK